MSKLKKFLDENNIKYVSIKHSPAYTAQEVAESLHISGKLVAKTVVAKIDGKTCMCVLSADCHLDLQKLKNHTGSQSAHLALEDDFRHLFPDCETGAMPPFGNLYGMQVFVDRKLSEDEKIVFNSGTHTEAIQMSYGMYEELVHPVRMEIC